MSKIKELRSNFEEAQKNTDQFKHYADKELKELKSNKEDVKSDLCYIAKNNKELKKYIDQKFDNIEVYLKALTFLNWFDFDNLASEKLAQEAFHKRYIELPESNSIKRELFYINFDIKAEEDLNNRLNIGDNIAINHDYYNYNPIAKKGQIAEREELNLIPNIEIKKSYPKPKVKYEEKVGCVWERPFNYEFDVVVKVYEYLKSVYETSKKISKYNDEEF